MDDFKRGNFQNRVAEEEGHIYTQSRNRRKMALLDHSENLQRDCYRTDSPMKQQHAKYVGIYRDK